VIYSISLVQYINWKYFTTPPSLTFYYCVLQEMGNTTMSVQRWSESLDQWSHFWPR